MASRRRRRKTAPATDASGTEATAAAAKSSSGSSANSCVNLCLDSCSGHVRDGTCDDAADGACDRGTDCSDCGTRRICSNDDAISDAAGGTGKRKGKRGPRRQAVVDVCMATILTADRVLSFHRLAASWSGWMSAAFLTDAFERSSGLGLRVLNADGVPPPRPSRIVLTLVRDEGYRKPSNRFPFNMLRNRAVHACPSELVMVVDVDFVLSGVEGAPVMASVRRLAAQVAAAPHIAMVLPAFEVRQGGGRAGERSEPPTKEQLRALWRAERAEAFAGRQYALGHVCDAAPKWLRKTSRFRMSYRFGCEPYLLLSRRHAP